MLSKILRQFTTELSASTVKMLLILRLSGRTMVTNYMALRTNFTCTIVLLAENSTEMIPMRDISSYGLTQSCTIMTEEADELLTLREAKS